MKKLFIFFSFLLVLLPFSLKAKNEVLPESVQSPSGLAVTITYFAISLGIFLAILMIVIAGFRFLTSTGNPKVQADAREQISAAFVGLTILLALVLILRTIHKSFVETELEAIPTQATDTKAVLPTITPIPPEEFIEKLKKEEEERAKTGLEVEYIELEGWKPTWPKKEPTKVKLFGVEVEIPLLNWEEFIEKYINYIYKLAITVGIILAFIMVVVGGIKYLKSTGNVEARADAKDQILSAFWGLLLLLGLVVILQTFHPKFVQIGLKKLNLDDIEVQEGVWICEGRIPIFEKYIQTYNAAYMKYVNEIAAQRAGALPEAQEPIYGHTPPPGPESIAFNWDVDKKERLVKAFKEALEKKEINPNELFYLNYLLSAYCQNFQASEAQLTPKELGGKIKKGAVVYLLGEYGAVFHQGLVCTGVYKGEDLITGEITTTIKPGDAGTTVCLSGDPFDENYTVPDLVSRGYVEYQPFEGYCQVAYRWHRGGLLSAAWEATNSQDGGITLQFTPYSITVFKDNGGEFYSYKEIPKNKWQEVVRSVFGNGATLYTVRNFGEEEDVPWKKKEVKIENKVLFRDLSPWTSPEGERVGPDKGVGWSTLDENSNPECKRGENCYYSLKIEKKKNWVTILSDRRGDFEVCEVFDEEDSNLEDNYVSVFCKHLARNQRFPCANRARVFPGYIIKEGEKPGAPFYKETTPSPSNP